MTVEQIVATFRSAGFHREAILARENGSAFQLSTVAGRRRSLGTYGDSSQSISYTINQARDGKVFRVATFPNKAQAEQAIETMQASERGN